MSSGRSPFANVGKWWRGSGVLLSGTGREVLESRQQSDRSRYSVVAVDGMESEKVA
jgi:hypothetical protein